MLDIQLDQADGYTICRPVGELDAFTVSQFRQALAELASSPRLLIDMSGVPFVDSAGLGALIGGIRRARELGGVACRPQGYLRHRHDRRRGRGLPAAYGAAVGTDEGGA